MARIVIAASVVAIASPPDGSTLPFVQAIAIALIAAVVPGAFGWWYLRYRERRTDDRARETAADLLRTETEERDERVEKLTEQVSQDVWARAQELLRTYKEDRDDLREEVGRARAAIKDLRERVEKLEKELEHANGERERLVVELRDALGKEAEARATGDVLKERLADIEARYDELKRIALGDQHKP